VALGDSYAAGEGIQPYNSNADVGGGNPPRDACHRSPLGYPTLLTPTATTSEAFDLACSGAITNDLIGDTNTLRNRWLEVPQLNQGYLDAGTTAVTIGIGGNDVGFGDVLAGCIATFHSCLTDPNYRIIRHDANNQSYSDTGPLTETEPALIGGMYQRYLDVFNAVRAKAPNARVYAIGYPHLFIPGGDQGCAFLTVAYINTQAFNDWTDLLDNVMQAAATDAGVTFVAGVAATIAQLRYSDCAQ